MALAPEELRRRAGAIRLAIFDVDGVLTDGSLILGPAGEEYKAFHARDGYGLVALRRAGIVLAVISGRSSSVVARRMQELEIEHVFQAAGDKRGCLEDVLRATGVSARETLYAGDDLPDLAAMAEVGLAVAVADAAPEIIACADWVTRLPGGRGAVREICDLILRAVADGC